MEQDLRPPISVQQKARLESQRLWLNRKVMDLQSKRWHGTLEIKITDGAMTLLERHEKEIPPQD